MFINSINYFRGISIIFIVFGHCYGLADFTFDSIPGYTIFNLTKGGTTFFVFISGFLFHHIFYKKFNFKRFIIKKTKYVLLPYLILSTIPLVYLLLQKEVLSFLSTFSHYLTGGGQNFIGYWYIPFIIIVFIISPLFVKFIKIKLKTQILIAFFLLICSFFMHRATNLNLFSIFQNVIFFTPIYLFGIISSEKKELIYSKVKGEEFYILCLVFILAIFQAKIGEFGNYHKDPFIFRGGDLMILQKILFCLLFMVFLNRFEKYKFRFLEIIATNSFGIFFIHGILIWVTGIIKEKFDFSFSSNSFIIYCTVASLVFFLSLITTLFVKRIFPKHSRYLVGS